MWPEHSSPRCKNKSLVSRRVCNSLYSMQHCGKQLGVWVFDCVLDTAVSVCNVAVWNWVQRKRLHCCCDRCKPRCPQRVRWEMTGGIIKSHQQVVIKMHQHISMRLLSNNNWNKGLVIKNVPFDIFQLFLYYTVFRITYMFFIDSYPCGALPAECVIWTGVRWGAGLPSGASRGRRNSDFGWTVLKSVWVDIWEPAPNKWS